ncbi:MAG: tRNA uridine-5-carboxymethylaminomethyl(34) synthesis GTPase MnmE [Acutalibacteraceae bacterium]|nr:tRNA uridine-5-carboxymethylaminomethyl(34) synthesis GTPase MnmE [Acutalibacteraceae bacterium]
MAEHTIAAIATPLGEGSVGVIRISGEKAFEIADKVFVSVSGKKIADISGYTALFGEVRNAEKRCDEAVALKFVAPKSYTGENVVELSVHGGTLLIKEALRAVLNAGAVLAKPGEFTKRAFLNGKMDLIKAESVMGLISASNESELRISQSVHAGGTSRQLGLIEKHLVSAAASIAAYCDYPEEDLGEINEESFMRELKAVLTSLNKLLKEYDAGKILREGIDTVIIGRTNVGKSTLMNLLSGQTKSIVTDIAGTTRDVIEETVMLGEVPLRLADTAGIRESDDVVENVGVTLARQRLQSAQLVLAVFSLDKEITDEDKELLSECKDKPVVVILNKCDIAKTDIDDFAKGMEVVKMSAKSGDGLEALTDAVARVTKTESLSPDSAVLVSERQRDLAYRAMLCVKEAVSSMEKGVTPDAVGVCVDEALSCLYEMTGKRATETVTEEIFRKFCVGK